MVIGMKVCGVEITMMSAFTKITIPTILTMMVGDMVMATSASGSVLTYNLKQ